MNSLERILASIVIICFVMIGALSLNYYNLNKDYTYSIGTMSELLPLLESEVDNVPKIFVGDNYLFGNSFNFSNLSNCLKQANYERYKSHLPELINFMISQVYLLNEDPELFEKCLNSIYDLKQLTKSENVSSLPFVAWKGKYIDRPMAMNYPEFSEYNEIDVWSIVIIHGHFIEDMWLSGYDIYYVNTETMEPFSFRMGTL